MTSPNSFISNSDSARYLVVLFSVFASVIAGLLLIAIVGARLGAIDLPQEQLLRYQLAKIGTVEAVETVFVGDSSLGNAVSADHWETLTGDKSLNLALVGTFGYAGSYNLLRHLTKFARPKNVVIFHTADILKRDVSVLGHLQSSRGLPDDVPFLLVRRLKVMSRYYFNIEVAAAAVRGLALRMFGRERSYIRDDYVYTGLAVGATIQVHKIHGAFFEPMINEDKLPFLTRIGGLCQSHGLNCVYSHGPIFEGYCSSSMDYFNNISKRVREAGLKMAEETPICVPKSDLADEVDHVRYTLRDNYTEKYYDVLLPYLIQNTASP